MHKNTPKRRNRRARLTKKIKGGDKITLKVMSYNVLARYATSHQKEHHGYEFKGEGYVDNKVKEKLGKNLEKYNPYEHIEQTIKRYEKIKEEINRESPDVVLLQEVDHMFFTYILNHLHEYNGYFGGSAESYTNGEELSSSIFSTAVIWKEKVFNKSKTQTLDVNNEDLPTDLFVKIPKTRNDVTKEVISFGNKDATLVKLKHGDQPITFVSVHLPGDRKSQNLFTYEKQNLIEYIMHSTKGDEYKIIGGDLNCPITDYQKGGAEATDHIEWLKEKMEKNNFIKVEQTKEESKTTCDFDYVDRKDRPDAEIIDSIFHTKNIIFVSYETQDLKCDPEVKSIVYGDKKGKDLYADIKNGSDHAWIIAELSIGQ